MTGKMITWWSSSHLSSWPSRYSVKIHPFSHCKFIMTSAFSQTLLSAGVSSGSRGLHTAPCKFRPCVLASRTFDFLLPRQNLVTGENQTTNIRGDFLVCSPLIFLCQLMSFTFSFRLSSLRCHVRGLLHNKPIILTLDHSTHPCDFVVKGGHYVKPGKRPVNVSFLFFSALICARKKKVQSTIYFGKIWHQKEAAPCS